MQPLDQQVHYGITDRDFLDVHDIQMDLPPDKLHQLRWKLNQKAKKELKFRFYALYDRDLYGSDKTYLNVTPIKKSLKKARDAIREKTGKKKCFKPTPAVVKDLNAFLRGWSGYFDHGYPRKAFRDLSHYTRKRMVTHLNRRSQRKYHRPKGMSHYEHLQKLGLQSL